MTKTPAILICVALVGAGAVVHGSTTHRWSAFVPDAARAERLHAHVVRLGDYQADPIPNDMPLKEKSIATSRRYLSASRNQMAMISVISGPSGAVSTHTPDVCYPASGYKTVREPRRETIELPGGGTAAYYVADFERKTATATERHRVRWAWSANGTWMAPDRPRFEYLRDPELFKLYIVTPVTDPDGSTEDSPAARQFVAAAFAQYAGLFTGR